MVCFLCLIYDLAAFLINFIIFGIHLMLAEVFDLYRAKCTKTGMQCKLCKADTFYFATLDQLFAEVKACSWCSHCAFILGIYGLVALFIFFIRLAFDIFWQRCLA